MLSLVIKDGEGRARRRHEVQNVGEYEIPLEGL